MAKIGMVLSHTRHVVVVGSRIGNSFDFRLRPPIMRFLCLRTVKEHTTRRTVVNVIYVLAHELMEIYVLVCE
jgi:hypothetical protein